MAIRRIFDPFSDFSRYDPDIDHDSAISVIMGIKYKRSEDLSSGSFGCGTYVKIRSRISSIPDTRFAEHADGIGLHLCQ